jgi:hypothetical protein
MNEILGELFASSTCVAVRRLVSCMLAYTV